VRAIVVVEVLPLLKLLAEELRVVDDDSLEHPVELVVVDPVGSFDLAVQPRGARPDVDVLDAPVEDVPVEGGLELRAVEFLTGVNPLRRP